MPDHFLEGIKNNANSLTPVRTYDPDGQGGKEPIIIVFRIDR